MGRRYLDLTKSPFLYLLALVPDPELSPPQAGDSFLPDPSPCSRAFPPSGCGRSCTRASRWW